MANIHHRMPVILAEKDFELWLDSAGQEPERVLPLVRPYPPEWLTTYEVSTAVNAPRYNSPDVLRPIAADASESTLFKQPVVKVPLHSTGAATRLAALFIGRILPVFSLFSPCPTGASPVSVRRGAFTTGC